jgi:hypothetical protein
VLADLGGRVDMIVDGGPTSVGLESTVIDLANQPPTVLRPGAVDAAALRLVLPDVRLRSSPAERGSAGMRAPGMLPKHYAPATPLMLFEGSRASALDDMEHTARRQCERGQSVAILAFREDLEQLRASRVQLVDLGHENDPPAVASRLYAALREGDELGVDVIFVRNITTDHPLSAAIQDRLRRAASPVPFPPPPSSQAYGLRLRTACLRRAQPHSKLRSASSWTVWPPSNHPSARSSAFISTATESEWSTDPCRPVPSQQLRRAGTLPDDRRTRGF